MLAVTCLALTIYYEARDQPLAGQLAVAEVVLNRVESKRYPDDICSVVWQEKQFSFTHDGKPERPRHHTWEDIQKLSVDILDDPEGMLFNMGATHYHATYVTPYWVDDMVLVGQVGDHVFYEEVR